MNARILLYLLWPALTGWCVGASAQIRVTALYEGKPIEIGRTIHTVNGDSLAVDALKFYLGHVALLRAGAVVWSDSTYRLIDFETSGVVEIPCDIPEELRFDALRFDLGVDSLHNVSGALGGDLDPVKGMYWAWQSGYINLKLEGWHSRCAARRRQFEFHLGGYLPPFQTRRQVSLPVSNRRFVLALELAPFFEQMDWQGKTAVMSPSAEAVALIHVLAKQFRIDEP